MRLLICILSTSMLLGCIDPKDRRPGLRLSGEEISGFIADWSFTNEHAEIYLETRTPYLLPHSVTIVCTALQGRLYVGARNPDQKRWVAYVERNPEVRLKIGDQVYEQSLEVVRDPTEREAVYQSYAAKYGWESAAPDRRPELLVFRVLAR